MKCNHKWIVLVDKVLPSAWEQMGQMTDRLAEVKAAMLTKKSITILACEKCGAIDKTIEEN